MATNKREKMLWNLDKTGSIKASKIREISILPARMGAGQGFDVKGWINAKEYFHFGCFDQAEDARVFVKGLHEQIEQNDLYDMVKDIYDRLSSVTRTTSTTEG